MDLMNNMDLRNMWQELEHISSSFNGDPSRLNPFNDALEGNRTLLGECSSAQTKKLTEENLKKIDIDQPIADFVEEHDEYGCDVSNETNNLGVGDESRDIPNTELSASMTGVKKDERYEGKKGRGRGRRRYCGNLGEW